MFGFQIKRHVRALASQEKLKSSVQPCAARAARVVLDSRYYMHVTPEDKARFVRDYARSIASGADFGRLSGMRNLGLPVDVSTLERLLLGEARCHQVIFKLSAVKGGQVLETRRKARPG